MRATQVGTRRLISSIQRHLAAIYRIETEADAAEFLLDEEHRAQLAESGELPSRDGQLLMLEEGGDLWLGLYLHEKVRGQLEARDPYHKLDSRNLASFLTAVEETSHFLYVVWNVRHGRPVTRLELELQGEVDKFASSALLLMGQEGDMGGMPGTERLSGILFDQWSPDARLDGEEAARYRTASRLAGRYCRALEARYLPERGPARIDSLLHDLRGFYRRRGDAKIRHMREN